MLGVLALLFLVVPIAELFVILQVSDQVGLGNTILVLIVVSIVGAWLVRYEGISVLRRLQRQVEHGEIPTNEIIDGALILFAGALMLTPGFLTDVLGIILLIPPSRAVVRTVLRRRFRQRVVLTHGASGGYADVWDVASWEQPPIRSDRSELE